MGDKKRVGRKGTGADPFSAKQCFDFGYSDSVTSPLALASHVRFVPEYVPSGTDCSSMRPIDALTAPRRRISSIMWV
jgi:hypothetical protein